MSFEYTNDQPGIHELRAAWEEVEDDMRFVIDCLRQATIEHIYIDEELGNRLDENFWATHADILTKEEQFSPGITRKVFKRFDEIGKERQLKRQLHFPEVIDPKVRLAGWMDVAFPIKNDEL